MQPEPDVLALEEQFWKHYKVLLTGLEQGDGKTQRDESCAAARSIHDPVDVIKQILGRAETMIGFIDTMDEESLVESAQAILALAFVYIDKWGRDCRVTADELQVVSAVTGATPLEKLRKLVDEKGHDYNSGDVPYLSYCIWGLRSILHEIHKRALRLFSLSQTPDGEAKFEGAPSTAYDLCAYSLFLLAYLATFRGRCGGDASARRHGSLGRVPVDSPKDQLGVCPIGNVATLCYVRDGERTLMLRKADQDKVSATPAYNATGGKLGIGEDPRECAIREVREECGLEVTDLTLKGIVTVSGNEQLDFEGEYWHLFIYLVTAWSGQLAGAGPEGEPVWIETDSVAELSISEGDRLFLGLLDSPGWFEGHITYEHGEVVDQHFHRYGERPAQNVHET